MGQHPCALSFQGAPQREERKSGRGKGKDFFFMVCPFGVLVVIAD